jgi:hypothetical protein
VRPAARAISVAEAPLAHLSANSSRLIRIGRPPGPSSSRRLPNLGQARASSPELVALVVRARTGLTLAVEKSHARPSRAFTSGVGAIRFTSSTLSGLRQCMARIPVSVAHGSQVPAPRIILSLIASALRHLVGPQRGTSTGDPRS